MKKYLPLAGYIATIVLANLMVVAFGVWPVWPFALGLVAPAGTSGVSRSHREHSCS